MKPVFALQLTVVCLVRHCSCSDQNFSFYRMRDQVYSAHARVGSGWCWLWRGLPPPALRAVRALAGCIVRQAAESAKRLLACERPVHL